MNDLKNSILFLTAFIFAIFGIAQIDFIEQNILNFDPIFFILIFIAVLSALVVVQFINASIYQFLMIWSLVYVVVRLVFIQRTLSLSFELIVLEFVLVDIGAGLAFDVARQVTHVTALLDNLATTTYPNKTLDMRIAGDRISIELNRSRRYHRPLSLLAVQIDIPDQKMNLKREDGLQGDILARFMLARVGQVIKEQTRETDLVLRESNSRFIIICPETEFVFATRMAERISRTISANLNAPVRWGTSSFPDEALTFEDLVYTARERYSIVEVEQAASQPAEKVVQ